jgi:hypothetical protein
MSTPPMPEPVTYVPNSDPLAAPAPTILFHGQRFGVSDAPVPFLSLMKLATLAKQQNEAQRNGQPLDPGTAGESMAILYELVRSLIVDEDWPRFERHANTVGAGMDEFEGIVRQAVEARAARPTRQPSGSPDGQQPTAPSSAAGSSGPGSSIRPGDPRVVVALEARGRPDLASVVRRAGEASTTS